MTVAVIILGVKLLKVWNTMRNDPQSDSVKKDDEKKPDAKENKPPDPKKDEKSSSITPESIDAQESWYGTMLGKMGFVINKGSGSKCVATDDMVKAFQKNNLFYAKISCGEVSTKCNIFFPKKGVALLPMHVFYDELKIGGKKHPMITVEVTRSDKPGGVFSFKADDSNTVFDTVLDCAAIHVPNCPDLKNRIGWLPLDHPRGRALARLIVRKGNDFYTDMVSVTGGKVSHSSRSNMTGGTYNTDLAQKGS
jgi:hypothetical protein